MFNVCIPNLEQIPRNDEKANEKRTEILVEVGLTKHEIFPFNCLENWQKMKLRVIKLTYEVQSPLCLYPVKPVVEV